MQILIFVLKHTNFKNDSEDAPGFRKKFHIEAAKISI